MPPLSENFSFSVSPAVVAAGGGRGWGWGGGTGGETGTSVVGSPRQRGSNDRVSWMGGTGGPVCCGWWSQAVFLVYTIIRQEKSAVGPINLLNTRIFCICACFWSKVLYITVRFCGKFQAVLTFFMQVWPTPYSIKV